MCPDADLPGIGRGITKVDECESNEGLDLSQSSDGRRGELLRCTYEVEEALRARLLRRESSECRELARVILLPCDDEGDPTVDAIVVRHIFRLADERADELPRRLVALHQIRRPADGHREYERWVAFVAAAAWITRSSTA